MSGNRIDYILLSPDLAAGSIASGILPLNHHVVSYHHASYGDIGERTLFSDTHIDEPTHGTRRKLQINKPTAVTKYLDKIKELFNEHKILPRIQNLIQQFKLRPSKLFLIIVT